MNMKELKVAFAAAIVLVSGINVFNAQKTDNMSDITLANVEALSQDENNETGTLYGNAAGTRFCCAPGDTRTCGAARC